MSKRITKMKKKKNGRARRAVAKLTSPFVYSRGWETAGTTNERASE